MLAPILQCRSSPMPYPGSPRWSLWPWHLEANGELILDPGMAEERPEWPHSTQPSSPSSPSGHWRFAAATRAAVTAPVLQMRYCATLREAEDLLDWLDANGSTAAYQVALTEHGFVVVVRARNTGRTR